MINYNNIYTNIIPTFQQKRKTTTVSIHINYQLNLTFRIVEKFLMLANIHKIYYFNHFQGQFSGFKYIHIVVQPSPLTISRMSSSSQIETLYPLNHNSPLSFPPASDNLCSIFCLYEFTIIVTFLKTIHPLIWFHLLPSVHISTMNIAVQTSIYIPACSSLEYIPRSEIAR